MFAGPVRSESRSLLSLEGPSSRGVRVIPRGVQMQGHRLRTVLSVVVRWSASVQLRRIAPSLCTAVTCCAVLIGLVLGLRCLLRSAIALLAFPLGVDGGVDGGTFSVGAGVLSCRIVRPAEHTTIQRLVFQFRRFCDADDVIDCQVSACACGHFTEWAELAESLLSASHRAVRRRPRVRVACADRSVTLHGVPHSVQSFTCRTGR